MVRFEILPYNPEWPIWFDRIKANLELLLEGAPYTAIEHVGSTSVPGMWAKAVIDIDIMVRDDDDLKAVISRLVQHGFLSKGFMGFHGRSYMRSPDQVPPRNLYVCVEGCAAVRNHFGVRRVLRENEALREEYSAIKRELGQKEWEHAMTYCEQKTPVLQKILSKCNELNDEERLEILQANKKSAARFQPPNAQLIGAQESGSV
jgi:GrpB-like predicted nucleotidyltransferase (UPF0157 family)